MIMQFFRRLFSRRMPTAAEQLGADIERRKRVQEEEQVRIACRANRLTQAQEARVLAAYRANARPLGILAARQGAADMAAKLARDNAKRTAALESQRFSWSDQAEGEL